MLDKQCLICHPHKIKILLLNPFVGFVQLSCGVGFVQYSCGRIMITCPYDLDPLTPHFYIVKVGFTGVYINFLFLL